MKCKICKVELVHCVVKVNGKYISLNQCPRCGHAEGDKDEHKDEG